MSAKKDYTNILYIRGLSPGLKAKFKARCAALGSNMTNELERLIGKELSRPLPDNKPHNGKAQDREESQ